MAIDLKRRYREILSIILNTDGCITGKELAKLCNVSIRTIRLDIKEINIILKEYNIVINSLVKKGYYLTENCKNILKENNIIRAVLDYEYIMETPTSPIDRQMYILSKLTIKEYVSVEELADELYVSISTVNNDIVLVKKWLKEKLNLKINTSLSKGIKLNGDEKDKRNIISWILGNRLNISVVAKYWKYIFGEIEFILDYNELYHIVNYETKRNGYFLSGHSSQLLSIEILVAVNRCKLDYNLHETDSINHRLMPVMIGLKESIKTHFQIVLSDLEWMNLQECLNAKQFVSGTNITNINTKESIHIVDEFLKILSIKFNINFTDPPAVKEKLLLYVAPMINRLKGRYSIANSIDENIIQNYQLEFKMANEISYIINEQLNLDTNLVELAYITLHLVSICNICRTKLNTLIVCDFDESIITYIKEKIRNNIGEKIKIYDCYTYQQFKFEDQKKLESIDLIVTTSTLADITNIPFIQVNPIMEEKDIINLHDYLYHSKKFN
jgi:lichenan operon transcriptional antiterminator